MLTDTLCTRCGLCCDGTLLGDVELTGRREATRLAALGLDVDGDDADVDVLALPCTGLCGTRCAVYAHRPQACRTFECRLLQDARRGAISVDDALKAITRARARAGRVRALLPRRGSGLPLAEQVAAALAASAGHSSPAARRRTRLRRAVTAWQRAIRGTFLD